MTFIEVLAAEIARRDATELEQSDATKALIRQLQAARYFAS